MNDLKSRNDECDFFEIIINIFQRLRTFLRSDSKCKKKFLSKKVISASETGTEEDG